MILGIIPKLTARQGGLFLNILSINYSLKHTGLERQLLFSAPEKNDYSSIESHVAKAIESLELSVGELKNLLLHFSSNFFHGTNTLSSERIDLEGI